ASAFSVGAKITGRIDPKNKSRNLVIYFSPESLFRAFKKSKHRSTNETNKCRGDDEEHCAGTIRSNPPDHSEPKGEPHRHRERAVLQQRSNPFYTSSEGLPLIKLRKNSIVKRIGFADLPSYCQSWDGDAVLCASCRSSVDVHEFRESGQGQTA